MNRYLCAKLIDRGVVRPFAPGDAVPVADLLFAAHGYTWRGRLAAAAGPGVSALIATGVDGRILGYLALRAGRPGSVEVAEAVLAPEIADTDLSRRLAEAAGIEAGRLGARKVSFAAPTFHAGGQRALEPLGLVPCALALGEHPAGLLFRGLGDERAAQRESFLVAAALPGERPARRVFLPERHAEAIRATYEALGAPREEPGAGPAAEEMLPARGAVEVELRETWQSARIRVVLGGDDTARALEAAVDDLRRGGIEHVEARVPLDRPAGRALVEALEALGFFFCGIDPEEGGRDECVLTRLLGARIDPGRLVLEDKRARALLAHVGRNLPIASLETAVLAAAGGAPPRVANENGTENERRRGARASGAVPAPPLEIVEFARLAGQKQLIAGLAHEINNPLNVILGSTYYLRQRLRDGRTDEVLPRLAAIEEEVARVARVLEGVNRFAHPEAAPRARVGIAGPVEDALALVAGEIRAAGIEVRRDLAGGDLPAVLANPAELGQVFFQLIRNALEASSPGGEIALEARRAGDLVVATVRDRGRGISLEDQRRVFEPFFTTKDRGVGAGLGLPIARAIVESHGGRLRLESRPGEGTAARVELPAAREAVEAA